MKKKFSPAFQGLVKWGSQHKAICIQYVFALLALLAGYITGITKMEWIVLTLCIGLVLALEYMNTAVEKVCDRITLEYDLKIKEIKDLSAAAVLIACIASLICGILIFIPYI